MKNFIFMKIFYSFLPSAKDVITLIFQLASYRQTCILGTLSKFNKDNLVGLDQSFGSSPPYLF